MHGGVQIAMLGAACTASQHTEIGAPKAARARSSYAGTYTERRRAAEGMEAGPAMLARPMFRGGGGLVMRRELDGQYVV